MIAVVALMLVVCSDRVMVLDAGQIAEFATPTELLKDTHGVFYGMCKTANLVQ